jgi:hypothetical protein
MLIAVFVDFFGQLVEGLEAIFRPSTWQVAWCACIVDQLVALVGSLGEPWRLARTMLLVSQLLVSNHKPRHNEWSLTGTCTSVSPDFFFS